jgi:hypothetical protein
VEFILLRDVTIFNKILTSGKFDNFITNLSQPLTPDSYCKIFKLDGIKEIATELKIDKNLVRRYLYLFKYISICDSNLNMIKHFKEDAKSLIYRMNKEDFDVDSTLEQNKKGGPYISFHDDPEFNIEDEIEEIKQLSNSDISSKYI